MTKKLSLEELKKLATPGKLRCEPGLVPYTHVNLISDEGEIASVWGVGAHLPPDGKAEANAALLAHRWNTHDELVEALERLLDLVTHGKEEADSNIKTYMENPDAFPPKLSENQLACFRSNSATCDRILRCFNRTHEAVLARAKTVGMP